MAMCKPRSQRIAKPFVGKPRSQQALQDAEVGAPEWGWDTHSERCLPKSGATVAQAILLASACHRRFFLEFPLFFASL